MRRNEIDQKLFEELIEKVIAGEMTRRQITKEYHISARTTNLMITELSKTNPELYMRFIEKYPYKPKEIENINFVELTKKIIKEDKFIEDLATKYNVSTRTIRRRITNMKGSKEIEPSTGITLDELYNLYKRYRAEELSLEDREIIETMKVGEIQNAINSQESRKNYLENIINQYKEYRKQGIPTKKAAKMLGYSFLDIYKKQGELARILTEQRRKGKGEEYKHKSHIKTQKEKMKLFKGGLKFSTKNSSQNGIVPKNPARTAYRMNSKTRDVIEK